jgi:hypothetical protein
LSLLICTQLLDGAEFQFNLSTDGGSNYNVVKTTTSILQHITEKLMVLVWIRIYWWFKIWLNQLHTRFSNYKDGGGDDDQSVVLVEFTLFNPSSTTFVKHFISMNNYYHSSNIAINYYLCWLC